MEAPTGLNLEAIDAWLDLLETDPQALAGGASATQVPPDWGPELAPPDDEAAPERGGQASPRRAARRRADALRGRERPSDLPPLVIPRGYVRDRRGTWRYVHDGGAVPGAKDLTLDLLWPFGRRRPIVVPADVAAAAPELRWAAEVGDPVEVIGRRGAVRSGWRVEEDDWEWRAAWPLGIHAPELAPDRLVSLEELARLAGGVAPTTLSGYLSRGRLVAPQVRLGGRPAWSLPIAVAWLSSRT